MAEFELPEKAKSRHERIVGLIIAAIAVVLAIVSSIGHTTQNEQILAHVDASDQYNFYQAKKERSFALQLQTDALALNTDRGTPNKLQAYTKLNADYAKQQAKLADDMKGIQAKGDDFMKEAERLEKKAHILDLGEIALQISIVLCSITILTEQRLFVVMGVCTAAAGIVVALWGLLLG
jgi:hypothetical protein